MNAQRFVKEAFVTKQTSLENLTCPECDGHALIEDVHRGELICSECGTVVETESFDFTQERRAFTAEEVENRKHNGSPISALSDINWTTMIKATDKNSSSELKRAVKWNYRLSWNRRNFLIAVSEIKRVCTNLSLPRIVAETAATLYKKVQKLNIMRGRSINGFVGACVHLAYRINKIPRSVDEVYAEMPTTTDRDIRICYRMLVVELRIKVPRINATAFLPRYASLLAISQESTVLAEKLLSEFETSMNTAGKDPKGMIAAAIYITCKKTGEIKSQKTIACGCLVTEVTLRSRIKELQSFALDMSQ